MAISFCLYDCYLEIWIAARGLTPPHTDIALNRVRPRLLDSAQKRKIGSKYGNSEPNRPVAQVFLALTAIYLVANNCELHDDSTPAPFKPPRSHRSKTRHWMLALS